MLYLALRDFKYNPISISWFEGTQAIRHIELNIVTPQLLMQRFKT